jgi:hypothetical protein
MTLLPFTLNVSHVPISVECLFSMTLQQGVSSAAGGGVDNRSRQKTVRPHWMGVAEVGRCKFKPVEICVESAWWQCWKPCYDRPLSSLAFNFDLRHYTEDVELLLCFAQRPPDARQGGD